MDSFSIVLMAPQAGWAVWLWLGLVSLCTCCIIVTDVAWFWIPDEVVLVLVLANGVASLGGITVLDPLVCLGVIVFFVVLFYLNPGGMGSGDVKLASALSLGCTAHSAFSMLFVAFILAAAAGSVAWLCQRRSVIPFGPFLLLGWWCSLFWGRTLAGTIFAVWL